MWLHGLGAVSSSNSSVTHGVCSEEDSCLPKHHGQMQALEKGGVVQARKKQRTFLPCEQVAVGKQTFCWIPIKPMLCMPTHHLASSKSLLYALMIGVCAKNLFAVSFLRNRVLLAFRIMVSFQI